MTAEAPAKRTWGQAFAIYFERPVLSMLFLGFSAGLPFFLVFSTLSAWLRTAHIDRATIGMLAWVGLMYSFKWAWAPIVDRVPLPIFEKLLGRRRSWMFLAQLGVALCLASLALSDPTESVVRIALLALGVAFFAATQDIAIDAWRIESATADKQGAMAAAYQIGYRTALMVASAGALIIADESGFRTSYLTMALLMGVGMVTTFLVREPQRTESDSATGMEERVSSWLSHRTHWPQWAQDAGAWFYGAVGAPLVDFFKRYGLKLGLVIFAFISTYRLTDYVMGTMTNTFYIDMGFTLTEVGVVAKFFGWPSTLIGAVVGGVIVAKIGTVRGLFLGSVLIIISNVFYASYGTYACDVPLECARAGLLDFWPRQIWARGSATELGLAVIVSFDNLALGVHGTALIAFMSSLTSARYTATQYAVLSSLYSLPGKLLMGTSGFMVNALGYGDFFLYTALLSIPGLLLLMWLSRREITARA
jgi:MFS transporter, PAT family, beta-lactamase induction signal transducer AmpG